MTIPVIPPGHFWPTASAACFSSALMHVQPSYARPSGFILTRPREGGQGTPLRNCLIFRVVLRLGEWAFPC